MRPVPSRPPSQSVTRPRLGVGAGNTAPGMHGPRPLRPFQMNLMVQSMILILSFSVSISLGTRSAMRAGGHLIQLVRRFRG